MNGKISPPINNKNSQYMNNGQMNTIHRNSNSQNPYMNNGTIYSNSFSPTNNGNGSVNNSPPTMKKGRTSQGSTPPKVKFLPFQPPRVSSQGKGHPTTSFPNINTKVNSPKINNQNSPSNYQNMSNKSSPLSFGQNKDSEIIRLQEKLKEALKLNNMATIQINKLNQQVTDYEELKEKYESTKKENTELLEKMETQQKAFTSKNASIEKRLEESKANLISIMDIKIELDRSKNDNESLKEELKNNIQELNELKENMSQVQKEKEEKEKEIEELKIEMKKNTDDHEQKLEQQRSVNDQALNACQDEIEDYKRQIQNHLTKIKSLEDLLKEQEEQIEVYKISEGDLSNLKKEFSENLAQFEIKDEEKTRQLNESLAEIEDLRKIIIEKDEIINSYKKNAVENDYLKGILEKKDAEMNDMIKKNEDLEASKQNLLNDFEKEKKTIQEKIDVLERENEALQLQNIEHDQTIKLCRNDTEKKIKEMENMEKTLSRTKEQLEKEKKAVLSIQSEYNNCQGMYNQAMLAIEKLEDTQTLLQKQLEGSKMKSDVMAKNYKESQTILQQKDTEKQQLTQQTEESMAAKEEEIRKMKDEFVETIEGLKSQYLEVKVYNDFLRKEIRKLKGIPEDILTEEMESETLQTNKELYKQIENQRIQIENLKEQLELSLNL
jgi:hypothetical protein